MDRGLCLHPVFINNLGYVPCNSCPNCRMKYRKQMAVRILMEQNIEKPDYSYFLTLTYNDEHIPKFKGRDCFKKADVDRFLDSLKHRLARDGYTYRYFLTCEYGEEGYRPHYHAILFLYRIHGMFDRVLYPRLTPGEQAPHFYFNDRVVQPLWGLGYTYQGFVTSASVLYCTSYALKDDEYLEKDWKGFEEGEPFRRYSLRPGLGLTDKCLSWWLGYVENDGKDYRNFFRINGPRKKLSTGIPVGVKRRLQDYPEIKEALTSINVASLDDMQKDLSENSMRYGSKMIYMDGKKYPSENLTDEPDKEIIAFRKALRKLNKDAKRL